ncbi:MAG: hypothetical protein ABIH03_02965 [Pseudomonadota bacterium]
MNIDQQENSTIQRWVILVALALCASTSAFGQVKLVTEEEFRASAAAPMLLPRATSVPGAPQIEIISPDTKGVITSPTKVQLHFRAVPPATPKPESFRALYGSFRLDITGRLLKLAKLTAEGLTLENASLPSGSHRIFLEIQDSVGRTGSQVLAITVR